MQEVAGGGRRWQEEAGEEANKFLLACNSIFRGVFIWGKNSVLCLFPEGGVAEVVISESYSQKIMEAALARSTSD